MRLGVYVVYNLENISVMPFDKNNSCKSYRLW